MENVWLQPVVDNYRKFFGDKDAKVVIDIGTRDGDDAEFLREKLSAEKVLAIDANPIAVEKTAEKYPSFRVLHSAISDTSGKLVRFYQVNSGDKNLDGCSSIFADKIIREQIFEDKYTIIDVPIERMDAVLENFNLLDKLIDVVKVDIEGFTYQCVIGFGLQVKNVKIFHLETEKAATHTEHKGNVEVAKLMRKLGFVLVDLSYEWGPGIQDQVWINRALADADVLKDFSELREK
jgi:FkbM family methyltransferase